MDICHSRDAGPDSQALDDAFLQLDRCLPVNNAYKRDVTKFQTDTPNEVFYISVDLNVTRHFVNRLFVLYFTPQTTIHQS